MLHSSYSRNLNSAKRLRACTINTLDTSVKMYCLHRPSSRERRLDAVPPEPAPTSSTVILRPVGSSDKMLVTAATTHPL
eukprot:4548512-Prymnesium_polylepis.2